MDNQQQKRSIKGPLIIIGIIVLIIVIFIGSIYFFTYSKCGAGGSYTCDSENGCFCRYSFVCKDCKNASNPPDCNTFCQSKGKSSFTAYGQPTSNIPITNIKRLPNGSFDSEAGPIQFFCYCK